MKLFLKISKSDHVITIPATSRTDGRTDEQTDEQTTCRNNTTRCVAKLGKSIRHYEEEDIYVGQTVMTMTM